MPYLLQVSFPSIGNKICGTSNYISCICLALTVTESSSRTGMFASGVGPGYLDSTVLQDLKSN